MTSKSSVSTSTSTSTSGDVVAGGGVPIPSDVAPFPSKLYKMVDDPESDAIISWGTANNSFVIWDHHAFGRDVLPQYFKHANFSSFVRQLNQYGFRKVDPDRNEFAAEGFLKGQKHLLKTFHPRKKHANNATQHQHQQQLLPPQVKASPANDFMEVGNFGLAKEVERLKRDRGVLMQKLIELRQYQQNTDLELKSVLHRIHLMEQNQQQMMAFLAIVVQSPAFVALVQQHGSNWWKTATNKKRRFRSLQCGDVVGQEMSNGNGQITKYRPHVPALPSPVSPVMQVFNSASQQEGNTALPMFMPEEPNSAFPALMPTAPNTGLPVEMPPATETTFPTDLLPGSNTQLPVDLQPVYNTQLTVEIPPASNSMSPMEIESTGNEGNNFAKDLSPVGDIPLFPYEEFDLEQILAACPEHFLSFSPLEDNGHSILEPLDIHDYSPLLDQDNQMQAPYYTGPQENGVVANYMAF